MSRIWDSNTKWLSCSDIKVSQDYIQLNVLNRKGLKKLGEVLYSKVHMVQKTNKETPYIQRFHNDPQRIPSPSPERSANLVAPESSNEKKM